MTTIRRIAWFVVAGGLAFMVDAGILSALVAIGGDPRASRLVSIAVATTTTWMINRSRTFGDRAGKPSFLEFFRYVLASGLAMMVNLGVYMALITWGTPFTTYPVLALAIATGISMGVNFWSYFNLVFKKR